MSIEAAARAWAHEKGLQRSRVVVTGYRWLSRLRYRNAWESDVAFRGARFNIGRDLSLYPAVRNGGFEAIEIDTFLPRVAPDAVVWDVGANIGLYAVLLARAAAQGRVVAFEPVPASRARLERNLLTNATTNVTVEPVALSSRPGTAQMAVHSEAHGCDQIVESVREDPDADGIVVETVTGDDYADRTGDPDVVKVDIEGHEPEFIDGAWRMFSRRKPLIMLEVNPTAWLTPDRFAAWEDTLARLFELYGAGDWIDATHSERVTSVDVHALGPHAFTLILPAG